MAVTDYHETTMRDALYFSAKLTVHRTVVCVTDTAICCSDALQWSESDTADRASYRYNMHKCRYCWPLPCAVPKHMAGCSSIPVLWLVEENADMFSDMLLLARELRDFTRVYRQMENWLRMVRKGSRDNT